MTCHLPVFKLFKSSFGLKKKLSIQIESSLQQECIPVGCVPSAAVAVSPATHVPPPTTHAPHHACPCHTSGGSRIFPKVGAPTLQGGHHYTILPNFEKLHQIERIWIPGGGAHTSHACNPSIMHDPARHARPCPCGQNGRCL